jgi:hypothetical protein
LSVNQSDRYTNLKEHEEYIIKVSQAINEQLPDHLELLNKIKQYGLQSV